MSSKTAAGLRTRNALMRRVLFALCALIVLYWQYGVYRAAVTSTAILSQQWRAGGGKEPAHTEGVVPTAAAVRTRRSYGGGAGVKIYVYELPERYHELQLEINRRQYKSRTCVCCNIFYAPEVLFHQHVLQSPYITSDPDEADFFLIPAYVACLIKNGARVDVLPNLQETERFLGGALEYVRDTFPYWNRRGGQDHIWLLTQGFGLNLFGRHASDVSRSILLVTNGQYSEKAFQPWKDITIPGKNRKEPWMAEAERAGNAESAMSGRPHRVWWVGNIHDDRMYSRSIRHYVYENFRTVPGWSIQKSPGHWIDVFPLMANATFCLCIEGWWAWTPRPYEALLSGCIPVLLSDDLVYPWERWLDYSAFSIKISPQRVSQLPQILDSITPGTIARLQRGIRQVWRKFHFPDQYEPGCATDMVLRELELRKAQMSDSMFSTGRPFEHEWNLPDGVALSPISYGTFDERTEISTYLKSRVDELLCHPTDPRKVAVRSDHRTHCHAAWPQWDSSAQSPPERDARYVGAKVECTQRQNFGAVLEPGESSMLYTHPQGPMFKIVPEAITASESARGQAHSRDEAHITVVSQATVDRVYAHLPRLAHVWHGPISLAVLVNDDEEVEALHALYESTPAVAQWVTVHLVHRFGHRSSDPGAFYPINVLRNVALQQVHTEWLMVLDIDVVPNACMSMYSGWITVSDELAHSDLPDNGDCPGLFAYVPPALELASVEDTFPKPDKRRCEYLSKDHAVKSLESGAMRPMHMYYPPAYMPTNHSRWMTAKEPFEVEYSVRFEPYYITRRHVVLFNESFVDRGGNYAQQVYAMYASGYRFVVLPGLFVVDTPHAPSAQSKWFHRSLELWDEFVEEMEAAFGVPVLPSRGPEYNQLKKKLRKEVEKFPEADYKHLDENNDEPEEQFTLVTQTYNRTSLMIAMLEYYCDIPSLKDIVVVWNNIGQPLPTGGIRCNKPILFKPQAKNSLSNRYRPSNLKGVSSEAVFMIDDDMIFGKDAVEFAFSYWRHNRDQLVGFIPRSTAFNLTSLQWEYGVQPMVDEQHEYAFILTGASFFSSKYMEEYWTLPREATDFVEEVFNCEDILLNYLIAMRSRKPPVWIDAKYVRTSTSGLFQKGAHFDKRSQCINKYMKMFGVDSLLPGNTMVRPVAHNFPRAAIDFDIDAAHNVEQ